MNDPITISAGDRYGQYTVIRLLTREECGSNTRPGRRYECRCDCGNIRNILRAGLLASASTRCDECRRLGRRYFEGPDGEMVAYINSYFDRDGGE